MNAGEKGNELAEFVCQEILDCQDEMSQRIMVSTVVQMLVDRGLYNKPSRSAIPAKPQPMSDMQVRAFRSTIIPLGKYVGRLVGEISLSYFCNLTDPNLWLADVRRYLANPLVQQEMGVEEE